MNPGNRCLLLLALCLLLVLNYPWLAVFAQQTLVFGLPLLHLYLFTLWLVIILIVGVLMAADEKDEPASGSDTGRKADGSSDAAE